MKECSRCKLNKQLDDFGKSKNRKDGLRIYCKLCNNELYKKWYTTHNGAEVSAKYRERNPEQRLISRKKWEAKNQWAANLSRYNLTVDDYIDMLEDQDGKCYICDSPPGNRKLHVDHDHITGKNRKLLCHACNTSLGAIKESIEILENMILYLEMYNDD